MVVAAGVAVVVAVDVAAMAAVTVAVVVVVTEDPVVTTPLSVAPPGGRLLSRSQHEPRVFLLQDEGTALRRIDWREKECMLLPRILNDGIFRIPDCSTMLSWREGLLPLVDDDHNWGLKSSLGGCVVPFSLYSRKQIDLFV